MVQMKIEDWKAEGARRFGKETKDWKFKCIQCGNVQSMRDFEGLVENPDEFVFFSCLGRVKKGIGCDWTLGGLFQIHKLEVIDSEGRAHPTFEFAETE